MVVIAIIGILAALGLGVFTTSRRAARDSRRLGDMESIKTALEQHYNDNGAYPTPAVGSINSVIHLNGAWFDELETYIEPVPVDPKNINDDLDGDGSIGPCVKSYSYLARDSGQGYWLDYTLEKEDSQNSLGTPTEGGSSNAGGFDCGGVTVRYRITR